MNGMKVIKYTAAVVTAAAVFGLSSAQAFTVGWAASGAGTALTLAGGAVGLPANDLIELATTTSSASAIQAAFGIGGQAGVAAVDALFSVWGTDYSTDGTDSGAPGTFSLTTGNPGTGFFSKQIYLLAFNATTTGGASTMGVFAGGPYASQANPNGDPWTFPPNDVSSISIEAADVVAGGVIIGSYGSGTDAGVESWLGNSPYNALELAPAVPEPSSIALVVLGMFGAIGLIRRRRS